MKSHVRALLSMNQLHWVLYKYLNIYDCNRCLHITFISCMLWFVLKQKNLQTYPTLIDISFLTQLCLCLLFFGNLISTLWCWDKREKVCIFAWYIHTVLHLKNWNKCLRTPWIVLITLHNNRIINNKFLLKYKKSTTRLNCSNHYTPLCQWKN